MGHKTRKTSQVLGRFKRQGEHLVLNLRGAREPGEWARMTMTALTASLRGDRREKAGNPVWLKRRQQKPAQECIALALAKLAKHMKEGLQIRDSQSKIWVIKFKSLGNRWEV